MFHASDLAIRPYIAKIEVWGKFVEFCRIFIYFYRVGIARGPVISFQALPRSLLRFMCLSNQQYLYWQLEHPLLPGLALGSVEVWRARLPPATAGIGEEVHAAVYVVAIT